MLWNYIIQFDIESLNINQIVEVLIDWNLHRYLMQHLSNDYTDKVNADKSKKNTIIVNQTVSIDDLHNHKHDSSFDDAMKL